MVHNHVEFSLQFFINRDVCAVSPVAVLNTVLNNQSKGANPIFYKCPTGASSYGLIVSCLKLIYIFKYIDHKSGNYYFYCYYPDYLQGLFKVHKVRTTSTFT